MNQIKRLQHSAEIFAVFLVFMFYVFSGVTSASVVISHSLSLHYDNGTSVALPSGTYQSLVKLDNVWYVDGIPYNPLPQGGSGGGGNNVSPTVAPPHEVSWIGNNKIPVVAVVFLIGGALILLISKSSGGKKK